MKDRAFIITGAGFELLLTLSGTELRQIVAAMFRYVESGAEPNFSGEQKERWLSLRNEIELNVKEVK